MYLTINTNNLVFAPGPFRIISTGSSELTSENTDSSGLGQGNITYDGNLTYVFSLDDFELNDEATYPQPESTAVAFSLSL